MWSWKLFRVLFPIPNAVSVSCFFFPFEKRAKKVEVSTPGVGWSWGSTLTPNYRGLGGGWNSATQQLVSN